MVTLFRLAVMQANRHSCLTQERGPAFLSFHPQDVKDPKLLEGAAGSGREQELDLVLTEVVSYCRTSCCCDMPGSPSSSHRSQATIDATLGQALFLLPVCWRQIKLPVGCWDPRNDPKLALAPG